MRKLPLTRRSVAGRVIAIALALGASAAPGRAQSPTARYSPRLGIYYRLVRSGDAYAAVLAADPVPGSPLWQDQIQLKAGDRILRLDGDAISGAAELENHFAETSVVFVNGRSGARNTRLVYLPPMAAPGVPQPGSRRNGSNVAGRYSPRLGIYYRLVRSGDAFEAVLAADPVPGSPMWQDQIQLEEGDRITRLGGNAITGPAELENHLARTDVAFINVRTGKAETRPVYLPSLDAPSIPNPRGDPVQPDPLPDVVEAPPPLPRIAEIPLEIPTLFPLTTPIPSNP